MKKELYRIRQHCVTFDKDFTLKLTGGPWEGAQASLKVFEIPSSKASPWLFFRMKAFEELEGFCR